MSGSRTAAQFDGYSRPALVSPETLESLTELPADYEALGSVFAQCLRVSNRRPMDEEWLSDVACSAELLRRALRERAAQAGGALLVRERCSSRYETSLLPDGPRISCRAVVAAPRRERRPEPAVRRPSENPSPSVEEAWNMRVDYTPLRRNEPRPPRRLDLVAELANQPLDHVSLGDVVVHCGRGCSLDGAKEAVRLVAAHVGADAAVGVHCVRDRTGWLCAGRASAFEREPGWSGRSP